VARFLGQRHGDVKSFEQEVEGAGITGRVDGGVKTIPATKIVGSVGRAQVLRSDFFYKTGKITGRFVRIGKAMQEGKILPPIEVYKARLRRWQGDQEAQLTEYYVVDGHHRVAMAKQLGQDFLDAHVVEYRVAGAGPRPDASASAGAEASAGAPAAPAEAAPNAATPATGAAPGSGTAGGGAPAAARGAPGGDGAK
jgi:hypothetical protein